MGIIQIVNLFLDFSSLFSGESVRYIVDQVVDGESGDPYNYWRSYFSQDGWGDHCGD